MPRGARKHEGLAESEETRRTLLQVAQELFMEYGYRAVSTRQIADACGLTQPALYHYFADKQQLYAAMAREELDKTGAALERIVRRGESLEERLQQAARYLLNNTQHDHGQMLHDIRHELDTETRASLNGAFQAAIVQPLSALFAAGLDAGALKPPAQGGAEPMLAAYLFLSMVQQFVAHQGSENPSTFTGRAFSTAESAAIVVRTLLYGLAP